MEHCIAGGQKHIDTVSMDNSHGHAQWQKPDRKEYVPWFCFYEIQGEPKLFYYRN